MNILLINPPKENEIIGNNPKIIEQERGFNPPLGLLYLAAYILKHTTHTISIIDAQVEALTYAQLKIKITEFNPDLVGITVMTMTLLDTLKTVSLVKNINSKITVVLGGPHVYLFPEETISLPGVDFLCLGEGEKIFPKLLENLNTPKVLCQIPGLVFKQNNKIINTGANPLIEDLDELPFPARQLLPYQKYSSLLSKNKIATTIFTSRGCPFKCSFCDRPHLGSLFRPRSAQNIIEEIQECIGLGINDFLFYDDTFTVNKQRVLEFCQKIIEKKIKINWDIRARIDTIDEEILQHLKLAGCSGIHYGVEAGTLKILSILNKNISLQLIKQVFLLTKKYRIPTLAYFMIGNPQETKQDIKTTFKFMKQLQPDYVHLTIFTPFPGTKLYRDGLANKIFQQDVWREFAKNPTTDFNPPYWNEYFSKEALSCLLKKGYHDFYLRPGYILKQFSHIRSLHELRKKIIAGIKVLLWNK